MSALEAARNKMKRSTDPIKLHDGKLLGRVLSGEIIIEDQTLADALVAVVKYAPHETTHEQFTAVLAGSFGSRHQEIPDMLREAEEMQTAIAAGADDDFVVDEKGKRDGKQHNLGIAFARLGISFKYDRLAHRKLVCEGDTEQVLEDPHVDELYLTVEKEFDLSLDEKYFRRYISASAHRNSFHPVLDYFDTLPETAPTDRLDTWLIRMTGAKDTPYVRAVSRILLVAAVRRVRDPGCKYDEMLVLESATQGTTKTSFVRALCPNTAWFGNRLPLHADIKRQMEATAGKWIIECGELAGMDKSDHNSLKDYLSAQVDESRMAYGHEVAIRPRHFVLIGTTNDSRYLKDQSGNRRYWPVKITRCDVAGLIAERDQLWAEACAAEAAGESIRLPEELWAEATAEQEERRIMDAFEVVLGPALDGVEGILQTEDAWKLCNIYEKHTQAETHRVYEVMTRLGWEKSRRRRGNDKPYCYVSKQAKDGQWLRVEKAERDGLYVIKHEVKAGLKAVT